MSELDIIIGSAKEALRHNRTEEALEILGSRSIEDIGEVIFLKGEIYFKLQKWGDALNHFSRFLEQFPSEAKAESYCTMIQNILSFYHKDMYNP
jgi:tetratricopeptide (TPR) repeat protein